MTRSALGLFGFTSRAITPARGTSSDSSSSRLAVTSVARTLTPVRLPPLRPAVFDRQILSLDIAGFAQSLAERDHKQCRRRAGRPAVEDADHRHRLLLRARSERPCRHHAGEKKYEIASPHAWPLALTASRDYGSRGPPRIGWAKGSFPPVARRHGATSRAERSRHARLTTLCEAVASERAARV